MGLFSKWSLNFKMVLLDFNICATDIFFSSLLIFAQFYLENPPTFLVLCIFDFINAHRLRTATVCTTVEEFVWDCFFTCIAYHSLHD